MSLKLEVLTLTGPLPNLSWARDRETDILSGSIGFAGPDLPGYTGTVQISGSDGSVLVLDFQADLLSGLDLVVQPIPTPRSELSPPAQARPGRVALDPLSGLKAAPPVELELPLRAWTDQPGRIWHLQLGDSPVVSQIRVADLLVVELDAARRLAGFWLENVPPLSEIG